MVMAFKYRLQKVLEFRIRKKEEQLLVVQKAQAEVYRIEQLVEQNKANIIQTRASMRQADHRMMDAYDKFLKSLYEKDTVLKQEKEQAQEVLRQEQEKLTELEKGVKVLEKHKEKAQEAYKAEMNAAELKRLSEVAVQKHFQKLREKTEEEMLEELNQMAQTEGYMNEY